MAARIVVGMVTILLVLLVLLAGWPEPAAAGARVSISIGGHHGHGHHRGHGFHHGHGFHGHFGHRQFHHAHIRPFVSFRLAPSYPVYVPTYSPVVVTSPPVVVAPAPAVIASPPAPAQQPRIVEYPHGRYELHGDGITSPYQWVWVPKVPPVPPPPPPPAGAPG